MTDNKLARAESGPDAAAIESVLALGDLSKLNTQQRLSYYNKVCESLGLNPLTRPFEFINLSGRLTFYARRDCTDQLRRIHGVTVKIVSRERIGDDVYVVTAQATLPSGRQDESTGAVPIARLQGEALANALMKAETKAKRRVTLSICGLSVLDESELEGAAAGQQQDERRMPITPNNAAPVDESKHDQDVADDLLRRVKLYEEMLPSVDSYDKALTLRASVGEPAKLSEFLKDFQAAKEGDLISIAERTEISRVWHKVNRALDKLEKELKTDVVGVFVDGDPGDDYDRGAQ